ncbi:MAG: lytic transglycosylase domain-containing protein [bacterium]|nr:lytic transglycosylase domain-containing protein [bacterium]
MTIQGTQRQGATQAPTRLAQATEPAPAPAPQPAAEAPRPDPNAGLKSRLWGAARRNAYTGSTHNCFQFSRTLVMKAGGGDVRQLPDDRSARGKPLSYLKTMIDEGRLKPGDVVYANYRPGTDPSSTNLGNGPHWFTYMGEGKFIDQYGTKSLAEMENFIPGRKIDAVVHPFPGSQSETGVQVSSVDTSGDPQFGEGDAMAGAIASGPAGAPASIPMPMNFENPMESDEEKRDRVPVPRAPANVRATPVAAGGGVAKGDFNALMQKLEGMGIDRAYLDQLSQKYGVPVEWILAVMMQESGGDPNAGSSAGARGLMQLMPGTFQEMGVGNNILDPKQNLEAGVKYLGKMHEMFGDWTKAVGHYNSGPGGNLTNSETAHYIRVVPQFAAMARNDLNAQV